MKNHLIDSSKERRLQNCASGFVSEDLKAFLDKELPPLRMWFVRRHVNRCHECHEEVVWLQRLGKNMRQLEDARPRPELRTRILATLPAMEVSSPLPVFNVGSRRSGAIKYAMGGAFCLLVLTGAFAALHDRGGVEGNAVNAVVENRPAPHVSSGENKTSARSTVANVGSAAQPVPVMPEDPTSKRANELYALEMKKEKELAARRLPDEWKQAIASVRTSLEQNKNGAQAYVMVAVDVTSVETAQKSLMSWAHSANGTVQVLPASGTVQKTVSVVITAAPSAGASLLRQLKKVGEISALKCEGVNGSSPIRVAPAVPLQSAVPPDRAAAVTDRSPAIAAPNKNGTSTPTTKSANIKDPIRSAIRYVVVLTPSVFSKF